jgi:hypothetical protein
VTPIRTESLMARTRCHGGQQARDRRPNFLLWVCFGLQMQTEPSGGTPPEYLVQVPRCWRTRIHMPWPTV